MRYARHLAQTPTAAFSASGLLLVAAYAWGVPYADLAAYGTLLLAGFGSGIALYEEGTGAAGDAHGNRLRSNTQFGSLTGAFGAGDGVIGLANAYHVRFVVKQGADAISQDGVVVGEQDTDLTHLEPLSEVAQEPAHIGGCLYRALNRRSADRR